MKKIYLQLSFIAMSCLGSGYFHNLHAQSNIHNAQAISLQSGKLLNMRSISTLELTYKDGYMQVVLQFQQLPKQSILQHNGIYAQGYLGQQSIIALIKQGITSAQLQAAGAVNWSPIEAIDKIGMEFQQQADVQTTVLIHWDTTIHKSALEQWVLKNKGTFLTDQKYQNRNGYFITIAQANLLALAQHPAITYISASVEDEALLDKAKYYTGAGNAIATPLNNGLGLTGKGVTIGVGDDSNPLHPDINDRLIDLNPLIQSAHGHHVTGTVGGAGLINEAYTGFSPKSTLISQYFSRVIVESDNYIANYNMNITNNSYGANLNSCYYFGMYDGNSQYIDEQVLGNNSLLHVFAAGNSAVINCSGYPNGYGTVAGHYQPSKNVLVVANMGKTETTFNSYSSIGPTKDGRIKPEITAVGSDLIATGNNNNYYSNTGTSMASPNVAGAAGLITEFYEGIYAAKPASALLKAVLINGADDVGNPGPDFKFGFGLMNVQNSINILQNQSWIKDSINTNQTKAINLTIPANVAKLKVLLYWHDAVGNPIASKMLVNDLDLKIHNTATGDILPWVLNHNLANVTDNATRGIDRRNNVEQVTLDNPVAGNYEIIVNGYDVPMGSQAYYVIYDYIYDSLQLRFPQGGEAIIAGETQNIYWNSADKTNPSTVSFSTDNGASWTVLAANINAATQHHAYTFPAINSTTCKIKVNKGGKEIISNAFSIIQRPSASLANQQCPGSIKINWNTNAAASSYNVYYNDNGEMKLIGNTAASTYTFTNLDQNRIYWVAVAPVVNGKTGTRSIAIQRKPNTGTCTDMNNGDLTITKHFLQNGRELTSNALSNKTPLLVEIGNQCNTTTSNFNIHYNINNGAWISKSFSTAITPGNKISLVIDSIDLSAVQNYNIKVAVKNVSQTDAQAINDTLTFLVRNIANPVLNLSLNPINEGFETASFKLKGIDTVGVPDMDNLDLFTNNVEGRLRSYIHNGISLNGQNALSLDNAKNLGGNLATPSINEAIFTYNLSNYTVNNEVRLEFKYRMNGTPRIIDSLNKVYIRANDQLPWTTLLNYKFDPLLPDSIYSSGSISLSDLFQSLGHNFSNSVQVKFSQNDTSLIASNSWGNGVTIDDLQLYTVTNDIILVSVDSMYQYNCAMSNQTPLNITIANGVNYPVDSIYVAYSIDSAAPVIEMIPGIAAKDTIIYTFAQTANMAAFKSYNVDVWIYQANDTYKLNDSILALKIVNQPVIATFPYLEGFENDNGSYYAEGFNNSWQHTSPTGQTINKAANGKYAWKTGTTAHNDNEMSRLYSPCFDISGLSNPMLSLNIAYNIEDKGEQGLFDYAYIEYSNNGIDWQKLPISSNAYNWYSNTTDSLWEGTNKGYWQVATTSIPKTGDIFSFRMVFYADAGAAADGIAIDDIHIYDNVHQIFNGQLPAAITKTLGSWSPMINYFNLQDNTIIAAIGNNEASFGTVTLNTFTTTQFYTNDGVQYYLPKNFVVHAENTNGDSATLRMYVKDAMMDIIRNDNSCYSCTKPMSVHELGITRYKDNSNKTYENGILTDNLNGEYEYISEDKVNWIPYLDGYYAELNTARFNEIWFNDGGPTKQKALTMKHIELSAQPFNLVSAKINVVSHIDTFVQVYRLQRLNDDNHFDDIQSFQTQNINGLRTFDFIDAPSITGSSTTYRILYSLQHDSAQTQWYSTQHAVVNWLANGNTMRVYPNPVTDGKITIDWLRDDNAPLYYEVLNAIGQVIILKQIDPSHRGGRTVIDVNQNGLANGMYFLRVHSSQNKWDFKISIQN